MRRPQSRRTQCRSLGVSLTAFIAHPPDLQNWSLMDMDFAVSCPLVRPALPRIRFLFVRSRFCSTLPSDSSSRFCPCASLVLHLHQVAQGTFTPKLPDMSDTQGARYARIAAGDLRPCPRPFLQPLCSAMSYMHRCCTSELKRRRIFSSSLAQPTFPICPNKKPATSRQRWRPCPRAKRAKCLKGRLEGRKFRELGRAPKLS